MMNRSRCQTKAKPSRADSLSQAKRGEVKEQQQGGGGGAMSLFERRGGGEQQQLRGGGRAVLLEGTGGKQQQWGAKGGYCRLLERGGGGEGGTVAVGREEGGEQQPPQPRYRLHLALAVLCNSETQTPKAHNEDSWQRTYQTPQANPNLLGQTTKGTRNPQTSGPFKIYNANAEHGLNSFKSLCTIHFEKNFALSLLCENLSSSST